MQIEYKNKYIQAICTDSKICTREYGQNMARKIMLRISELQSYATIDEMISFNIGRCHPLKGNRQNQYALDLVQPYRLIIENHLGLLTVVQIIEIVDYH